MKKLGVKGARYLKIIHLIFIAVWFGGVVSWFPLVFGNQMSDFDSVHKTYISMRSIAWNVIGWGGIGSLLTGLSNALFTYWGLFKEKWITVKFVTVICLILFGMFVLQSLMLSNISILESGADNLLQNEDLLRNHRLIKYGLILEAAVFISIITISVIKPWGRKKMSVKKENN